MEPSPDFNNRALEYQEFLEILGRAGLEDHADDILHLMSSHDRDDKGVSDFFDQLAMNIATTHGCLPHLEEHTNQ